MRRYDTSGFARKVYDRLVKKKEISSIFSLCFLDMVFVCFVFIFCVCACHPLSLLFIPRLGLCANNCPFSRQLRSHNFLEYDQFTFSSIRFESQVLFRGKHMKICALFFYFLCRSSAADVQPKRVCACPHFSVGLAERTSRDRTDRGKSTEERGVFFLPTSFCGGVCLHSFLSREEFLAAAALFCLHRLFQVHSRN